MQISDVVVAMIFFFSSVHGMYDDVYDIKRDKHPELYCHRLLEKIECIKEEMQESKKKYEDPIAYMDRMDYLDLRLQRLYAKLGAHEND